MSFRDSNWTSKVLYNALSPAAPGTVLGTPGSGLIVGLGQSVVCVVDALIQGATGGVLDIYIQSSVDAMQDGTGTWYDVIHYTQLAAAGAQVRWVATLSRGFNKIAAAPNAANPVDGTPSLTANTLIPDALGNALRVVLVAGASTSAGANQRIKIGLSQ